MNINDKILVVRQSNNLIEASYKIGSVGEQRLIRMLISKIHPSDEDFKTYRISVADFAQFFGLSTNNNSVYELIKKAADELAGRRIMLEQGKSWLRLNWLSFARYIEGSGCVELRFDKELKPYLLGLKGYFKQYGLENIINFKSGYSVRLFEILKVNEFKADVNGHFQRSFEYNELRKMLGIENGEYALFADFRIYAIQTAIKEINLNPDIIISKVEYPKTGRKVSHIVFHCEKAKKTQLNLDEEPLKLEEVAEKKDHPEYIVELIAMGVDEQTAYRWKRKYSIARLREAIGYTKAMKDSGKIRESVAGFLSHAVTNNTGAAWAEENKQKAQLKAERDKLELQKQKIEALQAAHELVERETTLAKFNALTDIQKNELRANYEASISGTFLSQWKRALKAYPDSPEIAKPVFILFLNFFKEQSDQY